MTDTAARVEARIAEVEGIIALNRKAADNGWRDAKNAVAGWEEELAWLRSLLDAPSRPTPADYVPPMFPDHEFVNGQGYSAGRCVFLLVNSSNHALRHFCGLPQAASVHDETPREQQPECAPGCDYPVTGYHAKRGGKVLCQTASVAATDDDPQRMRRRTRPEDTRLGRRTP